MKSLDVGTMFLVKGELDTIDDSDVVFEKERNVFAEVKETLDDPEEILKDNNYAYAKYKNKYYVVGEDVFKVHEIESLFKKSGTSSYFSEVRRPMKDGMLNIREDKMSLAIIQEIIKNLVGKPNFPGETLCFCVPGNPVNSSNNVLFHQNVLTNFIKSLGYEPECINEALALIFSENPCADDPNEPDGIAKFSGISISCGSGMCNVALAWKQLPLLTFSIESAGDWIDIESAKIVGCDVATITKYKERHFDFNKFDSTDMKQMALNVYYEAMIKNAIEHFSAKFENLDDDEKREIPLEIIVGGGTASVPGFIEKFKEVLKTVSLPFEVKNVRLAKNPLYAVSNGCLAKAISVENKKKAAQNIEQKAKSEPSPEPQEEKKQTEPKEKQDKSAQKIKIERE